MNTSLLLWNNSEKFINYFLILDSFGRQMHPFGPGGNKGHQGSGGSNHGNKEANLMPVPSPQQIQYLNPLEGQELTIQKQPNTSLRESDLLSPS